jgi:lipoic acid synthetase
VSEPLIQIGAARPRLPEWARRTRTHFESLNRLKSGFRALGLHTVCESARCPNIHECFHRGAATFMILGNVCTRGCGFCAVPKGRAEALDPAEPAGVARMAAAMNLRYVVLTSVNRDDLADGGSRHFAETIRQVRQALPNARVEALTPDFNGDLDAVARVLASGPHVFNHNMETVERLYRRVRPQARYRQSLQVLSFASQVGQASLLVGRDDILRGDCQSPRGPIDNRPAGCLPANLPHTGASDAASPTGSAPNVGQALSPAFLTKSGFMLGLGETESEVHALLRDLRAAGTDIVTIGQYLQPTRRNLPVAAYIEPRQFDAYRDYGLSLGFKMVFSGPLVRSSYMADQVSGEALGQPC